MTHAHASWRLKPDTPTSAVRFWTHGHTRKSSRSSSARGCRLCLRSMTATRLASSHRLRPSVIKRPDEEPCLLRILLRPISRPSLSRSSTRRFGHVIVATANELRKFRSTPGTARRATWVAVPKRRFHKRFPPVKAPPSSAADTPCRLPKVCPAGGSLLPCTVVLEDAVPFARTKTLSVRVSAKRTRSPTARVPGTHRRNSARWRVAPLAGCPTFRSRSP